MCGQKIDDSARRVRVGDQKYEMIRILRKEVPVTDRNIVINLILLIQNDNNPHWKMGGWNKTQWLDYLKGELGENAEEQIQQALFAQAF